LFAVQAEKQLPMNRRMIGLFALASACSTGLAPAAAAQLQLSTGIEYSDGNYGELTSTKAMVVPFSVKVSFGSLALRASVPYVMVRGPADVAPVIDDGGGDRSSNSGSGSGGGSSGSGTSGDSSDDDIFAADRDVHGLGDTSLSATWSFNRIAATALYVDITWRVRLPTGDQALGLGNGATDFVAQSEIGWDGGKGGVFISGGRRFLEATTAARVDGWQASAGYWRNIGKISVFGVQGTWRDAAIATAPDPRSVDLFLTRRLSTGWKFEVSGSAGLSDASPDYAVGLNFIWRSTSRR
jgi:hypothetical protein